MNGSIARPVGTASWCSFGHSMSAPRAPLECEDKAKVTCPQKRCWTKSLHLHQNYTAERSHCTLSDHNVEACGLRAKRSKPPHIGNSQHIVHIVNSLHTTRIVDRDESTRLLGTHLCSSSSHTLCKHRQAENCVQEETT